MTVDVVLVGALVPGVENHSLAVLGRALSDAGYSHETVAFCGFAGIGEMIGDVMRARPRICGISLQTTEAALATLAFAKLLRDAGFDGMIVLGGHLANLAADELLATKAIDVVVQLAGERAIVGLARGDDPRSLPGVRTAAGRGLPAEPVRVQAMRRTRLAQHLGFGTADLIVSRGCPAHCGYCCVSTASDFAEENGGARHIVRDVEPIADEIAETIALGGRAFHFMDDNILPLDPQAAIAWTRSLAAALRARDVPPIAFSLQLRADVVTPELAEALADFGLVRAYVGIDGYSPGQLRALGRHAPARAGVHALEMLASRGILCVANALVIGPTIRFETFVDEIEALGEVRHAPVHLLPIEARPGTVHHQRAAARGLIDGGVLWPAYRFSDERTFLVGEVITKLPTRLVERSVPIALYDLAWAVGVARRLAPHVDVARASTTYAEVTAAWNADQVLVLRAAAAAAREGRAATDALFIRERERIDSHDRALLRACDDAIADVERALSFAQQRNVRAHTRGRLLGRLAFTMGIAACGPAERPVVVDAMADVAADAAVCADEARTAASYAAFAENCSCVEPDELTHVQVTFGADGEMIAIRDENGNPLPNGVEQCLLELVATYCYPSWAGTTQQLSTCHQWIA